MTPESFTLGPDLIFGRDMIRSAGRHLAVATTVTLDGPDSDPDGQLGNVRRNVANILRDSDRACVAAENIGVVLPPPLENSEISAKISRAADFIARIVVANWYFYVLAFMPVSKGGGLLGMITTWFTIVAVAFMINQTRAERYLRRNGPLSKPSTINIGHIAIWTTCAYAVYEVVRLNNTASFALTAIAYGAVALLTARAALRDLTSIKGPTGPVRAAARDLHMAAAAYQRAADSTEVSAVVQAAYNAAQESLIAARSLDSWRQRAPA